MTLAIAGLASAAAAVAGTPAAGPTGMGRHPAAFTGPALAAFSASPPGISGPVAAAHPAPASGRATAVGPAIAIAIGVGPVAAAGRGTAVVRATGAGPGTRAGPSAAARPGDGASQGSRAQPAAGARLDAGAASHDGATGSGGAGGSGGAAGGERAAGADGAAGGAGTAGAVLARYSAPHRHSASGSDAPLAQTPRAVARQLLDQRFHWRDWQFKYLDRLWNTESGWNRYASNPYSGAYGIPQALPGSKMSSAGPDWRWNYRTQILWGMTYIRDRYRTPYWAWRHEIGYGWY